MNRWQKKGRDRVWKKWSWMGREGRIYKEEILAVDEAYIAVFWPTPGFKGRTVELLIPNRDDLNLCVHNSPLRGYQVKKKKSQHKWKSVKQVTNVLPLKRNLYQNLELQFLKFFLKKWLNARYFQRDISNDKEGEDKRNTIETGYS